MRDVSDNRPEVKLMLVDTINSQMSSKEMRERRKADYDKWMELAGDVFDLYELAYTLREDLIVLFVAHSETYEVNGVTKHRTKVNGQKLTKLNLAGKLSYNLYTNVEYSGTGPEYTFITQTDGTTEARSTKGVLPLKMPNDLTEVVHLIRTKELGFQESIESLRRTDSLQ